MAIAFFGIGTDPAFGAAVRHGLQGEALAFDGFGQLQGRAWFPECTGDIGIDGVQVTQFDISTRLRVDLKAAEINGGGADLDSLIRRAGLNFDFGSCYLRPRSLPAICKDFDSPGFCSAYLQAVFFASRFPFYLTEDDVLSLHQLLCSGYQAYRPGAYRNIIVAISGNQYTFQPPDTVQGSMDLYFAGVERTLSEYPPPLAAALLHQRLVDIHPFINGNGRVARLIMNATLLHFGYHALWVTADWRNDYSIALEQDRLDGKDRFPKLIERMVEKNEARLIKEGIST